jgi:hypothetical protein
VDFDVDDGWYADFPVAGERVNTELRLQLGTLALNTNTPTLGACVPVGVSFAYFFDYSDCGCPVDGTNGLSGIRLGDYLSSAPSVIRLTRRDDQGADPHRRTRHHQLAGTDSPVATRYPPRLVARTGHRVDSVSINEKSRESGFSRLQTWTDSAARRFPTAATQGRSKPDNSTTNRFCSARFTRHFKLAPDLLVIH